MILLKKLKILTKKRGKFAPLQVVFLLQLVTLHFDLKGIRLQKLDFLKSLKKKKYRKKNIYLVADAIAAKNGWI